VFCTGALTFMAFGTDQRESWDSSEEEDVEKKG